MMVPTWLVTQKKVQYDDPMIRVTVGAADRVCFAYIHHTSLGPSANGSARHVY